MQPTPARLAVLRAIRRVRPAPLQALVARMAGIAHVLVDGPSGLLFDVHPLSELGFSLVASGEYEPQMGRLLEICLSRDDVFVDVGANEGYFSLLAARRAARVIAFEPQPEAIGVLRRNIELNGVTSVRVWPVAAGAERGSTTLHVPLAFLGGAASVVRGPRFAGRRETVPVRTVDDVLDEADIDRVRLLKLDCEGAERFVIPGAGRRLAVQLVDVIALEYHPSIIGSDAVAEIHRQLVGWGYELVDHRGQTVYATAAGASAVAAWVRDREPATRQP